MARIIAGYQKAEIQLREIVNDGLLLQEKHIDELLEIKNESTKASLLVDLLLMVYLDGMLSEKQMDYAVGTMAVVGINKEKTYAIGNIVKGILEQKDELILAQAKHIDIVGVYCYMQNPPDGILVSDLNKAKIIKADKIIFWGVNWEDTPTIVLDKYQAKVIEFANCEFIGLQGLECRSKKLILKNCKFVGCETEENLFVLKNAEIVGCKFDGIKTYDSRKKHLLYLLDSDVTDTVFSNIFIQHNWNSPFGGVLKAKNSVLKNVSFDGVTTRSDSNSAFRYIFVFEGGRLVNCSFKNCTLAKDSFLLTISEGTARSQLVVDGLDSNCEQESEGYSPNRVDLNFDQVFGET